MSVRSRLAALALASACALAPLAAWAEEPAKPEAPAAEKPVCGRDLMTPEELAAHRQKMRSFQTQEERAAYRAEHHAKMMARAKERGVELPPQGCPKGAGMGMGPGGGRGPGPGPQGPR
jgi:hypothetical protein